MREKVSYSYFVIEVTIRFADQTADIKPGIGRDIEGLKGCISFEAANQGV